MLDVLIPHIVHMTYFDYTLPILQNFEKRILIAENLNEVHCQFCFLKVLKNWQRRRKTKKLSLSVHMPICRAAPPWHMNRGEFITLQAFIAPKETISGYD